MEKIKQFILKHVSQTRIAHIILVYKYQRKQHNLFKTGIFGLKSLFCFRTPKKNKLKGKEFRNLFNMVKIKLNDDRFIYNLDPFKTIHRDNVLFENMSIDYARVLDNSLKDLKVNNKKLEDCDYKDSQKELILGIEEYIKRIINALEKSDRKDKEKLIKYFQNIKDKKASSFEESLQRILFFNSLMWQTGHNLNGLGRLDKILEKYYENDLKKKVITKEEAKEMIFDFVKVLHNNYWIKSNSLMGDTGQIIILGGKEANGKYFCNDLTYLFIEVMKEIQLPDPKVLLRVTKDVPRELMELSLSCIKTGVGCPLFANDDVIIPKLIEFGYDKNDVYNYVTSACWEPMIVGKSIEQNNIDSIVYMEPFLEMFSKENLEDIKSYDALMKKYKKYLSEYISNFASRLRTIKYEKDTLLSLFTDDCNKKLKDVSEGGAKYNNCGVTSVSLGNVVNSIYNIKKYVFDTNKYTLKELNEMRISNYKNHDDVLKLLKQGNIRYGTDEKYIIDLANEISTFVNDCLVKEKNIFGEKFKFGLSAPSYITKSVGTPASFDGRKDGDPYVVHISTDKPGAAYTELIEFASKLDYSGHRFNGNVIDFMITPSFIESNFSKMVDFLTLSIDLGFFEMQMNVTSSDILIKAKANPKEYEHLIVRVWGFSAYFNDLPENYKDLLIERALKNEGKSY